MGLFRLWVGILGVFEWMPIAKLISGEKVHQMVPAFFHEPESDAFHVFYVWFLMVLSTARLVLAYDMANVGVLRLNMLIHLLETGVFWALFKSTLLLKLQDTDWDVAALKPQEMESLAIFVIVMLNAVLFFFKWATFSPDVTKAIKKE
eukprot:TRINITY_DN1773_c0_g1_i1.p1 TRINITY_DN1773_c0_g1~~TRINITY_DN1773_c0_g1_i1.p1  ORF type:complete len:148 (+),score=38.60 TRINITY_DN1773_c0_g1_i1:59-502(+)